MSVELMSATGLEEARRQLQICNACRYCEGYCAAFPAITRQRSFADGDITQIANLCHNCRGCYYACQYTAPHEFDLNLPGILAEVRQDSWETYVWPHKIGRVFQRLAWATATAIVLGFAVLFVVLRAFEPADGTGFYAVLSHTMMVAIFAPAFLIPLMGLAFGLRQYWRDVGGQAIRLAHVKSALGQAATMRNLAGGHGDGCNFETEDRFSPARRHAHHAIMYGFLLCFASTVSGTVLHYGFGLQAPYGLISIPKLLGVPGGILLTAGCIWMVRLKCAAAPELSNRDAYGAEMAFVALLGFIALSGLVLFGVSGSALVSPVLALHLGAVLAFFILTPYTKMAHGFFRLAALLIDAQQRPNT